MQETTFFLPPVNSFSRFSTLRWTQKQKKSIIDDVKPASLKNDPTLSYTFTTGVVPELMSDEILKDGYGNIIHELKVWLDSLHAPLKVLENKLKFSSS